MFPLLANVSLDTDQTIAATRLLLHIAHVDGAQTAEEVVLIRSFYEGAGDGGDWPDFASLQPVRAGEFSQTFAEPAQRDLVVAFCIMVAYADGTLSADEISAVAAIAAGIGMPPARVDELLALVKDHMLAQFARLPDTASVATVARELG